MLYASPGKTYMLVHSSATANHDIEKRKRPELLAKVYSRLQLNLACMASGWLSHRGDQRGQQCALPRRHDGAIRRTASPRSLWKLPMGPCGVIVMICRDDLA